MVSGKVTQTYSYCGGAAPPAGLLAELAKPVPYNGKKFYIRKGIVNKERAAIVGRFTTDKDGNYAIQLAPGIYSIIQEEQLEKIRVSTYKKDNLYVDEKCLQQWWKKPFYILKVENKAISNPDFNFQHRCFIDNDIPCITYIGPPLP